MATRYASTARKAVKKPMRRLNRRKTQLRLNKVASRTRAIATGLAKTRRKGAKVLKAKVLKAKVLKAKVLKMNLFKVGQKTKTKGWTILKKTGDKWNVVSHMETREKARAFVKTKAKK